MIEFMSCGANNRRQQMEFKEIKLTVQEQQQLEQDIRDKQHEYLFKVGYKREGIYIITFPNSKKYLGSSLCLGTRLKEIFGQLFWHNKIKQKWIEKALEENKKLKSEVRKAKSEKRKASKKKDVRSVMLGEEQEQLLSSLLEDIGSQS
jgi:hypothetical protein